MKVTPQQLSSTPGYPAHRRLTPLRAAIIAALACSVTACHDNNPGPAPEASQPVSQERKPPKSRGPVKQAAPSQPASVQTPAVPAAPPLIINDRLLLGKVRIDPGDNPGIIPDEILRFKGEMVAEPETPAATGSKRNERGTILEI